MIFFIILNLILVATISAIPSPPAVYSAIIYNKQNSPVQCHIIWSQPSGDRLQSGLFTIETLNYHVVKEQTIEMGTWKALAIIKEIRCGSLALIAPFDKVKSPQKNWMFLVQADEIVSAGPT